MERSTQATTEECPVQIKLPQVTLKGSLCLPQDMQGLVVFAHGSGSSRLSPRNRFVAGVLQDNRMGTLLFDLLTAKEEEIDDRTGRLRFDIRLLANRLVAVTDWLPRYLEAENLKLGYFGASTGAAAALVAAAERPAKVQVVVSRGGRPDLAEESLTRVQAPTLLIVGGEDYQVIEMNRQALIKLQIEKALIIIPGATHLFEERGALDEVARLASNWFLRHFLAHGQQESKE